MLRIGPPPLNRAPLGSGILDLEYHLRHLKQSGFAGPLVMHGLEEEEVVREIDLKLALDFISQLGALIHGFAPALIEESQLAGQFIGFPSLEPIAMIIEQFTNELCIGAIIFGAPWTKGLTKAGYLTGIDWIEFQELVVHQMIDQRPATLLQTD